MANGIKTDEPRGFNKGRKVPEFDKHLKKAGGHIGWNNKDEDNSLKILNDKKWKFTVKTLKKKSTNQLDFWNKLPDQ